MSFARNPGISYRSRIGGFTLIELMIVVAVVAILAAIAYPSYNDSVRKTRRGQAKADMVEMAQLMERFHTINNTYVGASAGLPDQSPKTGTARYKFAFNETQSTFVITATPETGQNKDKCGALGLNQAGSKTPTTDGCWN
ncbi:type IV pilin protein [Luteimonas gilva]|uniref:Type IV pilin protein n=1 Tax=Luteimonas gilva TaxID=2572684 RepID=A0A4U5JMV9_9GAMM|nr:type IV pilin protein [Luteimonas gilva]TKR31012.1 type IV pilin protein [Luteimonas gilva]